MTAFRARGEIFIRRPVAEVFDYFVNPDKITKFWLEETTGPLAPHALVTWHFMVPGATETVTVRRFEPPKRISFDWSGGICVNMSFHEHENGGTRVTVEADGFHTTDQAVNGTEGFTTVLCDLKTLLETGRSANLVRDKALLSAPA